MKQVLIIHGGNSFSKYEDYLTYLKNKQLNYDKLIHPIRWKERLSDELPDFDIILPSMPNSQNAIYAEWEIYFEKLLAMLENDVQIVGHSLGAMFLAQYLQDNPLTTPVNKLILVAGGYDDEQHEDMGSFKVSSATNLQKSAKEIHLFHSEDDPVVPFNELAKFQADLPNAISHVFKDRGHFISETFPEMLRLLKQK
jgi:predicted alpha/beta hydrolase family esterase